MTVTLIPYEDFPNDWNALDSAARKSLAHFLERLQAGPYAPDLQEACEMEAEERYAYSLPEGYVVYWQIVSASRVFNILPSDEDVVTVKLLAVRRLNK